LIDEFIILLALHQNVALSEPLALRFIHLHTRLWRHLPESYKQALKLPHARFSI